MCEVVNIHTEGGGRGGEGDGSAVVHIHNTMCIPLTNICWKTGTSAPCTLFSSSRQCCTSSCTAFRLLARSFLDCWDKDRPITGRASNINESAVTSDPDYNIAKAGVCANRIEAGIVNRTD